MTTSEKKGGVNHELQEVGNTLEGRSKKEFPLCPRLVDNLYQSWVPTWRNVTDIHFEIRSSLISYKSWHS